tara:strand:+ start:4282 stop:4830 length:549 start_codon:yes stop_codon:yes gene_type:complete
MKSQMNFGKSSASFSKAMRRYAKKSSKGAAGSLNNKAKSVCLRSIRETPKAAKSEIRASLKAGGLVYRLINKKGLTRAEIKLKAAAFIRARTQSSAYIKAGWYKAARVFGGRGGKLRDGTLAGKGSGKKATERKLTATMTNRTFGAPKVGTEALHKAMDHVRKDMLVYLAKKAQRDWKRAGR